MSIETSLLTRCKQRAVIEFLTAENCAPKEILGRLKKIYGDETIDISNIRRWVRSAKVAERGKLFEQEPDFFMHAYDKWILRLTKCIEIRGDYVEK